MSEPLITLLTPTGGRPEAFALCERWMSRQTLRAETEWLVADDGEIPTPCTMGQTVVRPRPWWLPRQNTLARNLRSILPRVRGKYVFVIEDDDYYSPTYLESMFDLLTQGYDLVGMVPATYYHVNGRYRTIDNAIRYHASLGQTAFYVGVASTLIDVCASSSSFIDQRLWTYDSVRFLNFRFHAGNPPRHVGMKGLPGRPGIGIGHHPEKGNWTDDPNHQTLRAWLGDDFQSYQRFLWKKN